MLILALTTNNMKINKKTTLTLATGVLLLAVCLVGINFASAQTNTPSAAVLQMRARLGLSSTSPRMMRNASSTFPRINRTTASSSPQVIAKLIAQADKEITTRISSLNTLSTRIGQMKNVTAAEISSLTANIQSQITTLTTLKTKIDADTDTTVLRTDLKSITDSIRVYMLVIPQGQIIAASDRLNTIASDLAAVGTKLQTRITAAQTAGKDVTSMQASLTDLNAKVADAQTQSQNAINGVSALLPDQGNTTTAASNTAALKQARTDIQTGTKDLQAARTDAGNILKAIKALNIPVTATTTQS